MNKLLGKIGMIAVCLSGLSLFGQSLSMRTETFNVTPQGSEYYIQTGVFMTLTGITNTTGFSGINATLTYDAGDNTRLIGAPALQGVIDPQPETGLQNPADPLAGTATPGTTTNNVIENGVPANGFMPVVGTDLTNFMASEVLPNQSGTIILASADFQAMMFAAQNGVELLIGVIEFRVDAAAGNGWAIDVAFDNTIVDNNAVTHGTDPTLQAGTTDGQVVVFGAPNCTGATVADALGGGAPGVNVNIDYLDPTAGGVGGDLDFVINHDAADRISWSGSDGSSGMVPAVAMSTMFSLNTQGDATPSTAVASVTYTLTPETEFPIGSGTFNGGTPCMLTVNWNAPTCTIVFDSIPIIGMSTNLDVTLGNVLYDGGNTRFGQITTTSANGGFPVDLDAPSSVAGSVLTYNDAFNFAAVVAGDVGTYTVSGASGPGGPVTGCSTFLGLACPTFNATQCDAANINAGMLAQNGGPLSVALDANDVADWEVDYNGTNDAGIAPAATPHLHTNPVSALDVDFLMTVNGFDSMGVACDATQLCALDFEAPTCDTFTQNPDSSVTPVNPGTMIMLSINTTNALSVTYDDGTGPLAMVSTSGVPETTYMDTWTATYAAFFPTTITVTVTNADGETTTCTTDIGVNCNASILSVGSPGSTGTVTIQGIGAVAPGLDYDIYYSNDCSLAISSDLAGLATFAGSINLTGAGAVQNSGPAGHMIQPDVCYYVTCNGSTIILDVFGRRTVPTLGEWGLMAFALLLMAAGVVHMRRRREV